MKNKFSSISILLFLFSVVLLVSCKSRKPVEPEKITDIRYIKEIVRDTVLKVKADSTFYDAWIECVEGKPILREPEKKKPLSSIKPAKALKEPKVSLDQNGKLTVECYKEVEAIKAQLKASYEKQLKEHQKPPIYIEKDLTWFQKSLMWMGAAFLLFILLIIILKIKNFI